MSNSEKMFYVIKRDGSKEEFKFSKIQKMIDDCAQGLDINLELFAENLMLKIRPGIATEEIQQRLVEEANALFVKDNMNSD